MYSLRIGLSWHSQRETTNYNNTQLLLLLVNIPTNVLASEYSPVQSVLIRDAKLYSSTIPLNDSQNGLHF